VLEVANKQTNHWLRERQEKNKLRDKGKKWE
jgi:hypothetical protein